MINPWDPAFKVINYWTGTGWQSLSTLEPVHYHKVAYKLDISSQTAYLSIDGIQLNQNIYSSTPKAGWGTEVAARFQAETISIYPPQSGPVPSMKVNYVNWKWDWYQMPSV